MSYQKELQALEEFKALSNDVEKWQWLMKNQGRGLIVYLDNDSTSVIINEFEEKGDAPVYDSGRFSGWIGRNIGAENILKAMGIECLIP